MIPQRAFIAAAAISISALAAYAYISTRPTTIEQRIEARKKGSKTSKEVHKNAPAETKNNEKNKINS
jgi:hypothetical protein